MAEAGSPRSSILSMSLSYYLSIVKYYFENSDKNLAHCLLRASNSNYYNVMPSHRQLWILLLKCPSTSGPRHDFQEQEVVECIPSGSNLINATLRNPLAAYPSLL